MVTNNASQELKWSSVALSEVIESGKRLDATKFDIELKKATQLINSSPYELLSITGDEGVCDSYRPGICKRIFVSKRDNSIEMLTPSQVTEINPKVEKYLSTLMKKTISNWFVKNGEILLSCSGTIGNVTLVTKTLNQKCVSQNMIRIVPKSEDDIGYIYAYLKSKVGQMFLTHNNYGAVIQHIDPDHLQTVKIPLAPKSIRCRIHDLIIRSYELRDESNALLDKAEQMLVEELKLPPVEEMQNADDTVETFNVKLSELNKRTDASYHVPVVKAIVNHLKEHADEVTTIGDERISKQVILPGRFKRVYVEEGYGKVLFGGKQIHELDPSGKKYLSIAKHSKRMNEELQINENTTLITRSGTIGKVVLVPRHWESWIASEHIIRVVPASKEMAGYISVFLASDYGYELITRYTYGSVVDEIDDNHVRDIAFPLLKDKGKQQEINALALEANEKRYQAYCLEQEALKIMDEEVIYAQ